jgi:catechol 2,3-dioxygenase-like lactoylglutathione lyase family enzyme
MTDAAVCLPVLPARDLAEAQSFYAGLLGFSEIVYADADYLIVRRGSMELHFWFTPDRNLAESTSCYLRGGEIPALYAEYAARGVPRLSAFEIRPWGMKEFYIHDPSGVLLRFGCAPEEIGA